MNKVLYISLTLALLMFIVDGLVCPNYKNVHFISLELQYFLLEKYLKTVDMFCGVTGLLFL